MSLSSDISSLFKQFGGRPDQYQEITQADTKDVSLERWPTIAKPERAARSTDGEQVAVAQPERSFAPLAVVATESVVAVKSPLDGAGDSAAPVVRRDESLQSLLAKLSQEGRSNAAVEVDTTPQKGQPQLSHISVIAVVSAKGGVGKSTMAANLATAMHKQGRPVLAVDLDPQNALHHHFQVQPGQERDAACGISQADQDWQAIGIPSCAGVFVLPYGSVSEDRRRAFESQLDDEPLWLAHQLSDLQLADGAVVIIDTPPGPSLYLQQALAVANVALIVSLSDAASYTALPLIENLIKTYTAERTDFLGMTYLINQLDSSRQLSKDITQIMLGQLGQQVVGVVHRDQSISEALAYNRDVMEYDPNGRGCLDVVNCAKTILDRLAAAARIEQPA